MLCNRDGLVLAGRPGDPKAQATSKKNWPTKRKHTERKARVNSVHYCIASYILTESVGRLLSVMLSLDGVSGPRHAYTARFRFDTGVAGV